MYIVSASDLRQFTTSILEQAGTPRTMAETVARHLVNANLAGHDSHGIFRLSQYCRHIHTGQVQPTAVPQVVLETHTTAVVDGQHGWGPVVAELAVETAITKAKQRHVAAVAVRRAYHVGRVGAYVQAIAKQQLIGLAFCNLQTAIRVAPWGGTESRMGTNPIAVGVPTQGEPIVVDMATTAAAEGKIRLALVGGRQVPLGWVLDAEGEFTTDPSVAYSTGTIAPLGGDQGHKGTCLAMVVDLLGGILSGAGCGELVDYYGNGMLMVVIDPAAFRPIVDFESAVQEYMAYLKSARRRADVDEILLAGEPEHRSSDIRGRDGIPIPPEVWHDLLRLADEYGVAPPVENR